MVGFTQETSYAIDDKADYYVQSVNEYGGLSVAAKAGETEAIQTVSAESAPVVRYDLQGRHTSARSGLMIQNGKVVIF